MLRQLADLCPAIIPENISTQEDPLSPLQQQMFAALHTGLYDSQLDVQALCQFYDTAEGYYWCIDPFSLLGCALDIATHGYTDQPPANVFLFVDYLMTINGPAVPPDQFLFEVRDEV